MISVTLWRTALIRNGACNEEMSIFDQIASGQQSDDSLKNKRIRVRNWTMLHDMWLRVNYGSFASWLHSKRLLPTISYQSANLIRANLDGANLEGANLYGANLEGANLVRANLEGANLYDANVGANNPPKAWIKDEQNLLRRK